MQETLIIFALTFVRRQTIKEYVNNVVVWHGHTLAALEDV